MHALFVIIAAAVALSVSGEPATSRPDPFAGAPLYVPPGGAAARDAARLRLAAPRDAALLDRIAQRPRAVWLGEWSGDVRRTVARVTERAAERKAVPVLVAYNIPGRDCGGHSRGGASSGAAYRRWIDALADGTAGRRAVVVMEPDALAGMDCLGPARRRERMGLVSWAVRRLEAQPRVAVYIDAGHSRWHRPALIAARLRSAGVVRAQGFALNVSNFNTTASEAAYGRAISRRTGGAHFVVDTSRNGRGPARAGAWCNPPGRGLGVAPTTRPGLGDLLDALLWVKIPGESDGRCNGGPPAGRWWLPYALGLAGRAAV